MKNTIYKLIIHCFITLISCASFSQKLMTCDTQQRKNAIEISTYQKNLIEIYSSFAFEIVNNELRYAISSNTPHYNGRVNSMTGSFDELSLKFFYQLHKTLCAIKPVSTTQKVYRGMYSSDIEKIKERFQRNQVYREYGFMSTSSDLAIAEQFTQNKRNPEDQNPNQEVLITLTGFSGVDISSISKLKNEKEILFNADTLFKVVNISRAKTGRWLIEMVELKPDQLSQVEKESLALFEKKRNDKLINENILPQSMMAAEKFNQKNNPTFIQTNLQSKLSILSTKAAEQMSQLNSKTSPSLLFKEDITIEQFGEGG